MSTIFALASVVIKELYRRKDFYVLFVLTGLITLVIGSVNFFHDDHIVRVVKDVALLLIWLSTLVIAIMTTARQIPAERENRTIFPLLAKPVSRAQVIVGKFAGCWFACGIALVMFYFFFGIVVASREHHGPLPIFYEGFVMHFAMLAMVVALALLGSVVFTAPSSNTTICAIVVIGLMLFGGHLNQVALQQAEPARSIIYTIYFLVPHLEWYFDVRNLIMYDHSAIAVIDCCLATLYSGLYSAFLLFATWVVFRRKALTL